MFARIQALDRCCTEPGCEQPVVRARCSASLDMSQSAHTKIETQSLAVLTKIACELLGAELRPFRYDYDGVALAALTR